MTIAVVATGGTISSHLTDAGWTSLDGRTLVDEVADRFAGIEVTVTDVATGPSSNLTVDDMLAIAHRVRDLLAEGVDGVVVLHGTDTMELTAFVTQLVLGNSKECETRRSLPRQWTDGAVPDRFVGRRFVRPSQ